MAKKDWDMEVREALRVALATVLDEKIEGKTVRERLQDEMSARLCKRLGGDTDIELFIEDSTSLFRIDMKQTHVTEFLV